MSWPFCRRSPVAEARASDALRRPIVRSSLALALLAPFQLVEQWQAEIWPAMGPAPAAMSLFVGRVRGTTDAGVPLEALELEHYPGMSERLLEQLARSMAELHRVEAVGVAHRVGTILPGEPIVVVAAFADRRGPAQRCCQELLEALKHEAPFWKREWSGGTGTWVVGNTPLGIHLPLDRLS
jgi:molybdopterin synthase catalytic subunit